MLWKIRTFEVSIIIMEMTRKAAKYLSQACKNFLPAQGVKMEVGKSANELINHKPQIYELILQIQGSALRRAEKKRA